MSKSKNKTEIGYFIGNSDNGHNLLKYIENKIGYYDKETSSLELIEEEEKACMLRKKVADDENYLLWWYITGNDFGIYIEKNNNYGFAQLIKDIGKELKFIDIIGDEMFNVKPWEFKPFEKVLVCGINDDRWLPKLYGRYDEVGDKHITLDNEEYEYYEMVKYEGNEYKIGYIPKKTK